MAALGGALYVPQVGIINPSEFAPANSIEAVIWVAVGGRGTLYGAMLGAVLVNLAKTIFTGRFPEFWLFALGGAVHLRHAVPAARHRRAAARAETDRTGAGGRLGGKRRARGDAMTAIGAATDTILYVNGVTVSFDGFRALNNLSLVLAPGEMRAVIGPNGAGKTTMMDVITGKTRPDKGEVVFGGGHRPDAARRAGDRPARHRPQVPEADRVRDAHGLGQSAAGARRRPAPLVHAGRPRDGRRSASGSRRSWSQRG